MDLKEILEGCERAKQRIDKWSKWKKEISNNMKIENNKAKPVTNAKQELIESGIQVIDVGNLGYVALKGVYGDDEKPAKVARLTSSSEGKKFQHLIRHLMRNYHSTPIEFNIIELEIALPIFVERQWVRHRTATTNEVSGRYSELPCENWELIEEHCVYGPQGDSNRQGSSDIRLPSDIAQEIVRRYAKVQQDAKETYEWAVKQGLTLERARVILPLSTYTRKAWTTDLHNLFGFLKLRLDSHAQAEIRAYAEAVAELVKQNFPVLYQAFEDYRLNAIGFSAIELKYLKEKIYLNQIIEDIKNTPKLKGFGKTERVDFINKLEKWRKL